ncbi:MAG: hypothetical protein SFU86_17495, partial [Pirellulaceae bacterium]|nr:hypothetical protein [Pirellulaceae bacterium]
AAPGDARLQARVRVAIASQAALALRDLGRPADVDRITQTLLAAAASDPDDGRRWAAVARLFWQLGKYDDALSAAAIATGFMPPSQVFGEFIKPQAALAGFWFGSAKDIDPLVDRQKGVEAAVWMSVPRPPAGKEVADWKQRVDAAAVHVRKLEPKVRAAYLSLIAETCLVRGDRALAKSFHAEAATSSPAAAIKGGDLAAGDSDWAAAETWYRQAAEAPDSEPLALFLLGRSLVKLDRQEEGERLQKLATLLPLAPEARFQLASGLQERGLAAEAIAQFEIIGRTAGLDSAVAANAAQQLGNLVSAKEPLRAADGWRQLHLHVLNVSSNFVEVEGYLTLPHVIHKVRARGLFDQKKMPEVLVELATCQKLLPGDVRLVEEFVPRLEKEGLAAEAEKLFAAAHEVHAKIAQAHPTSAAYTNNTAWISARARRKLDEALPLAQKAIELAPREAAYHDTLAEIQFQRGDRPAAVAAAKKALALAPGNAFYEKRLAHFETAEPGQPSAVEIP